MTPRRPTKERNRDVVEGARRRPLGPKGGWPDALEDHRGKEELKNSRCAKRMRAPLQGRPPSKHDAPCKSRVCAARVSNGLPVRMLTPCARPLCAHPLPACAQSNCVGRDWAEGIEGTGVLAWRFKVSLPSSARHRAASCMGSAVPSGGSVQKTEQQRRSD